MPTETVSREDWLAARLALLEREKAFTHERDALSAARRALPRVRIDTDYRFQDDEGPVTLIDLFGPHRQLIIQHFMLGPDWEAGCKSCSFWADSFDKAVEHLAARDTGFCAVSRAPLDHIRAYQARMGWGFRWVSSLDNSFNYDFAVSFAPGAPGADDRYNYVPKLFPAEEMPGVSVFVRDGKGNVYHTYSTYARGLDALNSAYQLLDLTPLGRNEEGLDNTMAWLRRRDEY